MNWSWIVRVVLALTAAMLLVSCVHDGPSSRTAQTQITVTKTPVSASSTIAELSKIAIKGRGPKTGYSRAQFGPTWFDVDKNKCDTRDDILARDLTDVARSGTCTVASGMLRDPYTATVIRFNRGPTSSAVQIDHVVPLGNAWVSGAARWTAQQRLAYANDPKVLLAVSGPSNEAKGDRDAATWLPPNRAFWCAYATLQTDIKLKYGLSMTQAEHDTELRILQSC